MLRLLASAFVALMMALASTGLVFGAAVQGSGGAIFAGGTVPNATTFSSTVGITGRLTVGATGITTASGSGNTIILDPDGNAMVDVKATIQNSDATVNSGAVRVADNVWVDGSKLAIGIDPALVTTILTIVGSQNEAIYARNNQNSGLSSFGLADDGGAGRMGMGWGNSGSSFSASAGFINIGHATADLTFWRQVTNKIMTITTNGIRLDRTLTALVAADCDADAEVASIVKYSKNAAADITACVCEKEGGVYAWTPMTATGDCT